jgi:crossover junction endodeoxyribonuclease RuvC
VIIAIDPSLASTGLAVLGPSEVQPYWAVRTIRSTPPVAPPNPALAQVRRMEKIVAQLRSAIQELAYRPTYFVIEGPAFSKNNGMAHERAGLWWMIYQMAAGHGGPVLVVKPNLRAKYATGNGQAGKDEVLLAASRRYPGVPMTNNNEADAVVLAAMGARILGRPVDQLPKTHLEAMKTLG